MAPLSIVIVGAGLGGLAAAYCFAKDGHHVKVLERNDSYSPKGNIIMIRPGASRIFRSWGLGSALAAIADECSSTHFRDVKTGDSVTHNVVIETSDSPDWGTDRQAVMELLYRSALDAGAELEFNAIVDDVLDDLEQPSVTLRDGRKLSADLILAADGIRSRIRPSILSDLPNIDPIMSDITFYGVRPSTEQLQANPIAKKLVATEDSHVWIGKNKFAVGRTSLKLHRYGILYGIDEKTDQTNLWDENGDIEYVRKVYSDSDPTLQAVLRIADTCDRWKLAEMPDISRWTSKNGRILLLGDSAHAMIPNAAQGFSQIIEDIEVLQYLLNARPLEDIPTLTRIWQDIRKPRAERIKEFARWNTKVFLGQIPIVASGIISKAGSVKSLKEVQPDGDAPFSSGRFVKWAHNYDVAAETQKYLDGARAKI